MLPKTQNQTAVLLFARTSTAEVAHKKLLLQAPYNKSLHHGLRTEALKKAKNTGLTVFNYSEKQQTGNSFGERFANAFQQIFNKGYSHVLAIGSDCPELTTKTLKLAADELCKDGGIVLGPDCRGGAYLVGLSKNSFNKKLLIDLSWQSPFLLNSFSRYAEQLDSPIVLLESKFDLNTTSDIDQYLTVSCLLQQLLVSAFNTTPHLTQYACQISALTIIGSTGYRGPPAYSYAA